MMSRNSSGHRAQSATDATRELAEDPDIVAEAEALKGLSLRVAAQKDVRPENRNGGCPFVRMNISNFSHTHTADTAQLVASVGGLPKLTAFTSRSSRAKKN